MRKRTKSSSPRKAKTAVPVDEAEKAAAPKRVKPPLVDQFYVAVDRQLKSGYGTYEAAAKAALVIKKQHPQLQVTVYDAKEQQHTIIERPRAGGNQEEKSPRLVRGARSEQQRAI